MIPGWMSERELGWLARAAAHTSSIAEIGCWRGRTTQVLSRSTRGTVVAVDTWSDSAIGYEGEWTTSDRAAELYSRPDWLWREFQYNLRDCPNVVPLRMTSLIAAALVSVNMLRFDLIFLDADHGYQSVRDDILAWRPLLREGGILCGHDYNDPRCPEVASAVRSLLPNARVAYDTIWVA